MIFMKGATCYEANIGNYDIMILRPRFWYWPRRHWQTKKIEFPNYIRIKYIKTE